MTQVTPALTWQNQSNASEPLANYTLNFATDLNWQFTLPSVYLQRPINPNGVTIDNSAGPGTITLVSAGFTVNVLPFSREDIDLSNVSQLVTITLITSVPAVAPYSVPIVFWLVKPSGAQQNQFGIIQAVQTAIASNFLGSMQPIINSGFTENPTGIGQTLGGALDVYTILEGWMLGADAAAGYTVQQRALAGVFPAPFGIRVQRTVFSADTNTMKIGTALTSVDSAQFLGQICTVSFDIVFGSTMPTGVTCQLVGGTGTDQPIFPAFTGNVVLGSVTVPTSTISGRITFTTTAAVPANLKQIGLIFSTVPTGVGNVNDFYQISRPQIDIGQTAQQFRTVPQMMERDRCLDFFEVLNDGNVVSYAFATGQTAGGVTQPGVLPFKKKRVVPAITSAGTFVIFLNGVNVAVTGLTFSGIGKENSVFASTTAGALGVGFTTLLQDAGAGTGQILINARM